MSEVKTQQALVERLFGSLIGAMDLLHVYVGEQLGLYQALAVAGPLTSGDLAMRCEVHERYAREWLGQQAVAGILTVDDADADPAQRRFALPAEHAEVLLDGDSLSYMTPLSLFLASVARTMPQVLEAFRTGDGVPYDAYGPDLRRGIARINRPMFLNLLAQEWFPQVPGLVERLTDDPPARVADVGCGSGWSSIAIAQGFPKVEVTGLDLDPESVSDARRNAEDAGVGDRVTFEVRDAADPAWRAVSTWSVPSRRSTTCAIQSGRCARCGRCGHPAGRCWWPTNASPTPSPSTSTTPSASSGASAPSTASRQP